MRGINLPKPLTSGHLCPDCGGTGADAEKTRAAYKSGHLSKSPEADERYADQNAFATAYGLQQG